MATRLNGSYASVGGWEYDLVANHANADPNDNPSAAVGVFDTTYPGLAAPAPGRSSATARIRGASGEILLQERPRGGEDNGASPLACQRHTEVMITPAPSG